MSITDKTVTELSQGLENGFFSSCEITDAFLKRIEDINPIINAYITIIAEQACKAAAEADKRRAQGQTQSKLDGIPLALEDSFCVDGVLTTCASRMLYNFKPPYSATCWSKLAQAGAILLAKANMDEFAMGISTETSAYGRTLNPFNIEYVPGGSCGGAAVAVAADLAAFALGLDSGGGVRQPAHFCGVVGFKPSYGRVSRFGIVPMASSMDQSGILAKSVCDAAIILETLAGADVCDANTLNVAVGAYVAACGQSINGLKIGIPREFLELDLEPATAKLIEQAALLLREAGAQVDEVSLPHTKYALPAYFVLSAAEVSSNLARFDGVNYGLRVEKENVYDMIAASRSQGFGTEAKLRILLGAYFTSAEQIDTCYNRALRIRTLIKRDYDTLFESGYACLLTPVSAGAAFKPGSKEQNPGLLDKTDFYTAPLNMAGLPGLSLPFSIINGLPRGLQLIGRSFDEETLFKVAAAIEQPRIIPTHIVEQVSRKGVAQNG
ncbi:MAG: Asp-tRNA(Asn)/Glu-tRNA(Gln) amidotransferase subunit GatA [Clostridiales bacterium]|nr:Asp-tRNA(Asn)/Glu-tRNA(Gln) amidotransferase subunit GatA [Clostridiales bacterium]